MRSTLQAVPAPSQSPGLNEDIRRRHQTGARLTLWELGPFLKQGRFQDSEKVLNQFRRYLSEEEIFSILG